MVLSDALSRRADAEERKEKDRTAILLPDDLFVRILDTTLTKTALALKESEYDDTVLERL